MTNTQTVPASSNARADANRRNAEHSTGPRTEAGKVRSSQNAVRSGWFSRDLRVAEGLELLYSEFTQTWLDEIQPQGILELEAFSDYVRSLWHKREIIQAQNEATASSAAAFLDSGEKARSLDRLHRYEREFERRAARALRELRRLQTDRACLVQLSAAAKTNPPLEVPAQSAAALPPPQLVRPPLAAPSSLAPKRTQAPPLDLPEDLRQYLHALEIETNHWNARYRANRAGLPMMGAHAA